MQQQHFSYAGFWKRFTAYLIDSIILGVATMFLFIPLLGMFGVGMVSDLEDMQYNEEMMMDDEAAAGLMALFFGVYFLTVLVASVAGWLYFALMEASSRQGTLGKLALGIKVTDLYGNRISFGRATGRYFGKIISGAIFMIGYIMAAFTERKQALHDIMASCLVVDK